MSEKSFESILEIETERPIYEDNMLQQRRRDILLNLLNTIQCPEVFSKAALDIISDEEWEDLCLGNYCNVDLSWLKHEPVQIDLSITDFHFIKTDPAFHYISKYVQIYYKDSDNKLSGFEVCPGGDGVTGGIESKPDLLIQEGGKVIKKILPAISSLSVFRKVFKKVMTLDDLKDVKGLVIHNPQETEITKEEFDFLKSFDFDGLFEEILASVNYTVYDGRVIFFPKQDEITDVMLEQLEIPGIEPDSPINEPNDNIDEEIEKINVNLVLKRVLSALRYKQVFRAYRARLWTPEDIANNKVGQHDKMFYPEFMNGNKVELTDLEFRVICEHPIFLELVKYFIIYQAPDGAVTIYPRMLDRI